MRKVKKIFSCLFPFIILYSVTQLNCTINFVMRRIRPNDCDAAMSNKFIADKVENRNLLYSLSELSRVARNSHLSEEFYEKNKVTIEYLKDKLNISFTGVVLFSVFLETASFRNMSYSDVADYLGITNIEMLNLDVDVKSLIRSGYLRSGEQNMYDCQTYKVPQNVVAALLKGEAYQRPPLHKDNSYEVMKAVDELLVDCKSGENFEDTYNEIRSLLDENEDKPMIKQFNAAIDNSKVCLVLMDTACKTIFRGENLTKDDLEAIFGRNFPSYAIYREMAGKRFPAVRDGYLQEAGETFMNDISWELTEKAKNELFCELRFDVKISHDEDYLDLIQPEKINYKKMIYGREAKEIAELENLLSPAKFNEISRRLESKGMRRGFACLLYGGPGTGKTETVLQLARKSHRAIFKVNVSDIKSKWHGESERNARRIFERYARMVERCALAPILFLNEADGILGKRREDVRGSADQCDNSIQNIFLEGIENLNGILIATTNLETALDEAFERRFIYKCRFEQPTTESRTAIWRSMMPDVSEETAARLADEYTLSGGQIENISRKLSVKDIIYGDVDFSYDALRPLCEAESLQKKEQRKAIGF